MRFRKFWWVPGPKDWWFKSSHLELFHTWCDTQKVWRRCQHISSQRPPEAMNHYPTLILGSDVMGLRFCFKVGPHYMKLSQTVGTLAPEQFDRDRLSHDWGIDIMKPSKIGRPMGGEFLWNWRMQHELRIYVAEFLKSATAACLGDFLARFGNGRILEVPSHQACIMGWVPPPNIINVPCLPFFHNTSMFSFCQKASLMKDMKKLHLTYRHSPAVDVGRVRSHPHFCKGVVTDCSKVATQHGDASHVESGQ